MMKETVHQRRIIIFALFFSVELSRYCIFTVSLRKLVFTVVSWKLHYLREIRMKYRYSKKKKQLFFYKVNIGIL